MIAATPSNSLATSSSTAARLHLAEEFTVVCSSCLFLFPPKQKVVPVPAPLPRMVNPAVYRTKNCNARSGIDIYQGLSISLATVTQTTNRRLPKAIGARLAASSITADAFRVTPITVFMKNLISSSDTSARRPIDTTDMRKKIINYITNQRN